ncbi:transcriptional repressor TCF25-domain-containing protein [Mucidula mucida]|nr:transcriptional repressor TCF25-domain-containing protein [Mucidula mucida]
MPPRLNKRQQRELEELEALKKAEAVHDSEDDDDEPMPSTSKATGFAALFDPADDDGGEDDDAGEQSKARKSKKKKKKSAAPVVDSPRVSTPTTKSAPPTPAGNDELDEALAELSLKYGNIPAASTATAHHSSFSFQSYPSSATWAPARMRDGLSVRPLTDLEVSEKRDRLSVELLRGEKWWTVEYSKKYKGLTQMFLNTVQGGDPQGLFDMCRNSPWHADTLLQMAQVFRHREEHAQSVDFTDRALFAYERAFVGAFTFTTGLNRLDFDFVENRVFFLAIHRQAADLQRRGCLRTAFEFARLMYSLDPWGDPHGAVFHLDYLVFKAGMTDWLLEVFKIFSDWRQEKAYQVARLNPSILPGWLYARALALKVNSKPEEAAAALIDAVNAFPAVVPVLADKLDASLPASLRSHRHFRIEADGSGLAEPLAVMHLLCHLYVQRSLPVWKDHANWFGDIITQHFSTPPASIAVNSVREAFLKVYDQENLRYAAYRHIMVLEYRTLFRYIPRFILAQKSLDCDPLPPPTAVTSYDAAFFEGVEIPTMSRRQMERRLALMIPDAAARAQFEALYAVPRVAAMFPGGILQMVQALQDMPAELMEGMQAAMVELQMGVGAMEEGIRGEMPGQMPGEAVVGQAEWEEPEDEREVEEDNYETDEDEQQEDEEADAEARMALAAPFRAISNWVVRGIWGTPQEEAESSEEERDLTGDID